MKLHNKSSLNKLQQGICFVAVYFLLCSCNKSTKIRSVERNFITVNTSGYQYNFELDDTTNLFKEQEYVMVNYKTKAFDVFQNDTPLFTLGLIDKNQNGVFNDFNKDMLAISHFKNDTFINQECIQSLFIKDSVFIWNNKKMYFVTNINKEGSILNFGIYKEITKNKYLKLLDTLPHIPIQNFQGEDVEISGLINNTKLNFIDFWATWCMPCIEGLPILDSLYEHNKDKLHVILICEERNYEDANEYIKKMGYDKWINCINNPTIAYELMQYGFPYGLVVTPSGEIIARNIRAEGLEKYIQ